MPIHMRAYQARRGTGSRRGGRRILAWSPVVIILTVLSAKSAEAAVEKTLYAFNTMPPAGALQVGGNPTGTLLRDASGAFYGATSLGGMYYNGVIFKLSPPATEQTEWKMSILYTFTGGYDGGSPNPVLVMDNSGAIYGSTQTGGSWLNQGLVFKLTPPAPGSTQWTETVLHYFYNNRYENADDGANPSGGLIMDRNGNLYGTTDVGGSIADPSSGFGTVFKLTPLDAAKTKWQETVLYRFTGVADGQNPMNALTLDAAGALYGTTIYGGTGSCSDLFSTIIGCGTVFKLTPPGPGHTMWTKTTLHSFTAGADGFVPQGKLLLDAAGAIYGTTIEGGGGACTDGLLNPVGCGIVYKLSPPSGTQTRWAEAILHSFQGPEGAYPQGGLIMDATGTLFGTTSGGGPMSYGVGGYGVLFKLAPPEYASRNWTETALYNFDVRTSGSEAVGELIRDSAGHFFGVTYSGGPNLAGTIYEIIL
jgi:uncharacterized repeat protein (TIGR03803 family)